MPTFLLTLLALLLAVASIGPVGAHPPAPCAATLF
jgi:hypothetical protein